MDSGHIENLHRINYRFVSDKEDELRSIEVPMVITVGIFKQLVFINTNSKSGPYDFQVTDDRLHVRLTDQSAPIQPDSVLVLARVPSDRIFPDPIAQFKKDEVEFRSRTIEEGEGAGKVASTATIGKMEDSQRQALYRYARSDDGLLFPQLEFLRKLGNRTKRREAGEEEDEFDRDDAYNENNTRKNGVPTKMPHGATLKEFEGGRGWYTRQDERVVKGGSSALRPDLAKKSKWMWAINGIN